MLKSKGEYTSAKNARLRLVALVMIGLIAHAVFLSITHYHRSAFSGAPPSTLRAVFSGDNDFGHAPNSGSHSHCLSCCLQRNFISDVRPPAIILDPLPGIISHDLLISELYTHGSPRVLSDRAPPLV